MDHYTLEYHYSVGVLVWVISNEYHDSVQ